MTLLALEFSSEQRSVAVARNGIVLGEASETGGRTTHAFSLIEKIFAESKIGREKIEAIAVGLGPGSYTGIRAAIAVAQGWQLARGVKLFGISSVEAIATQAQMENFFGRVNVVVDAQRGEFYLATWEISDRKCHEVAPLQIVNSAEMELRRQAGELFTGPETGRITFPSGAIVARLASGRSNFTAAEDLNPIYLRETNFIKTSPTQREVA